MFATILKDCHPAQPVLLWEQFKEYICDDLKHHLQVSGILHDAPQDKVENYGLYLIDEILFHAGIHNGLKAFLNMPLPDYAYWTQVAGNRLIAEQLAFDAADEHQKGEENIAKFNAEQAHAFNIIKTAIYENKPQMFFLHGPAGTGKTFTDKTLCYVLRGAQKIVLCCASSGIAALLLPKGRTAHSTFKIPIELFEGKLCAVSKNSDLAELLCQTSLIIWDEVPMQDKYCQEAVDLTMRDIQSCDKPFGGVTVVFGGDFQQILPVVWKGSQEQIVGQCIQRSRLWPDITVLHLKENKRLSSGTAEDKEYAEWLLKVGKGLINDEDSQIKLDPMMKCGETIDDLISAIYPSLNLVNPTENNDAWFSEHTILCPLNDSVDDINFECLNALPGGVHTYHSADAAITGNAVDGDFQYPVEFLNNIKGSGLPLSNLQLKIGAPIMILCNLNPSAGVCNGTRAIITRCTTRVLEARILTGDNAGQITLIPHITLTPSNLDLPFIFSRRQYPVRLGFAMSINKSQGQSVTKVGLNLQTSVFTHGQLYVALSRCTTKQGIKAIFAEGIPFSIVLIFILTSFLQVIQSV